MAPKEVASVHTSDTSVARAEATKLARAMREMYMLANFEVEEKGRYRREACNDEDMSEGLLLEERLTLYELDHEVEDGM